MEMRREWMERGAGRGGENDKISRSFVGEWGSYGQSRESSQAEHAEGVQCLYSTSSGTSVSTTSNPICSIIKY